jgi:actin-related protein
MDQTKLLLNAYYEALYLRLEANKALLAGKIEHLLKQEIAKRSFADPATARPSAKTSFDDDKFAAYRDACLAFVDERIETYNPIGIQYTFDRLRAKEVLELELQLNWYDSRAEFQALVQAARDAVLREAKNQAEAEMTQERLKELADELIGEVGAFPDKSIISAYEAEPALNKLPDYIVGLAIEEILR